MIKKVMTKLLVLLSCTSVFSQEHFITNLYVYDLFLMNPAAAGGEKDCNSLNAYYQKQWVSMDAAPSTQVFSYQRGLTPQLGMGTYIFNDKNGYTSELGLQQSFSYELPLIDNLKRKMSLTFGLSLNVEQSKIDQAAFVAADSPFDPIMYGGVESGWGVNANSGFMIKYNKYHVGMSVTNLLPQNNPMYKYSEDKQLPLDLHVHGGTSFKIPSRDVFIFPEIMYRRNKMADSRFDINFKLKMPTFNEKLAYWSIITYRRTVEHNYGTDLSASTTLGLNYSAMSVGLEYQFSLSGSQSYYGNAFQLVLGYRFNCDSNKGAVPCSFQDYIYEGISNSKKSRKKR